METEPHPQGVIRRFDVPIDRTDRWISARFLPIDHHRALQLILAEGLVESALAATALGAQLRTMTRRVADEQDPAVRALTDAIVRIVESALADLQAEHGRIVRHTLRRASRELGLT